MLNSKLAIATILTISSLFLSQITHADDRQTEEITDCKDLNKYIVNLKSKIQSNNDLLIQLNNPDNQLSPDYIKDRSQESLEELVTLNNNLSVYEEVQSQNSCLEHSENNR